jgi:osmotically inducible protein OsmC
MERKASVDWKGSLKEGEGKITGGSGALHDLSYSYATRFGEQLGTNPEELIASAHAGCFTMALAHELEKKKYKPETLHTEATVNLNQDGAKWSVTDIHLEVQGKVQGATEDEFEAAALEAKKNCPISRLFNAKITVTTKLVASQDRGAAHLMDRANAKAKAKPDAQSEANF